jgi:hypothetical protein|tara:strand:+ start:1848 stop:2123 length:276 start_codon:yes stop_codon:yes gene_type:complete
MASLYMQRSGELTIGGSMEQNGLPILMHESQEDLDSLVVLIGSLDRFGSGKYHLNKSQVTDCDPYGGSAFNFGDLVAVQNYVEDRLGFLKS